MVCSFVLLVFSLQLLASLRYGKIQFCLCAVRLLLSMNSLHCRKNTRVTKCSISEAFFSQLPCGCSISSVCSYAFPQSLCTLKTAVTFSYTWSCLVRKLESRKNTHQHEQWFACTFPLFLTRGSQHVLPTLINYSFCEAHTPYGLNYIAEETEVHQISSPSICRGWVPIGPNELELQAFTTCKYLPARLPIKSTADLETTEQSWFPASTLIRSSPFPQLKEN